MRVIRANGLSDNDRVLAQTVALRVVQTLRKRTTQQGGLSDQDHGRLPGAVAVPGKRPLLIE